MSTESLETAIYDLSVKSSARRLFADDAQRFLSKYALAPDEVAELTNYDVKAMYDRGVNPMLTMGLWLTGKGPHTFPNYLEAMRGGAAQSSRG